MSDAGVTVSPEICSGEAYCGVIILRCVAVGSIIVAPNSGSSSLAIPKSSNFGVPSRVTRMFDGLMSR